MEKGKKKTRGYKKGMLVVGGTGGFNSVFFFPFINVNFNCTQTMDAYILKTHNSIFF